MVDYSWWDIIFSSGLLLLLSGEATLHPSRMSVRWPTLHHGDADFCHRHRIAGPGGDSIPNSDKWLVARDLTKVVNAAALAAAIAQE